MIDIYDRSKQLGRFFRLWGMSINTVAFLLYHHYLADILQILTICIIKGANNGNAKMVEIALELLGEKPADNINKEVRNEAIGALTMLGFSPAPSAKVVGEIMKNQPDLPVEKVVKLALKQIK